MTTMETGVGPVIEQVQTDTFCPECGYNLHTQSVARDERLGILVCRCPECGRYSAAGHTTTASLVWLNRLGTVLLAWWVAFLLGLFALCTFFLGLLAYGHTMEMTQVRPTFASWGTTRPARPLRYGYAYGYASPYRYEVRHIPASDPDQQTRHRWAQGWLTFFAILLGLITGGLFSALLWHCKGPSRVWGFLPPVVGCGTTALLWFSNPMTEVIEQWGMMQIGQFFLIEALAVALGIRCGRAFARGLVSVLVPAKARQHLSFLRITDGKTLKPL